MQEIEIRCIQPEDNVSIATIIRESLAEFGANKPGTVYYDESTDHLFELFQHPGSIYYIALREDTVVGGAGIYPSPGLPEGIAELVKMYLKKEARGLGLGRTLINKCLNFAKSYGYHTIYLETMPELKKAVSVYEKFGFEYLDGPMGNTGHFGCDVWMKKEIKSPGDSQG
jgi:putative acetyltransferase